MVSNELIISRTDRMTKVPFIDLHTQYLEIKDEILLALEQVGESSRFALGPEVESFEQNFAEYCNVRHCVALNSGTSALHLALMCSDVRRDDEVITVPMTFVSTISAISYIGAKPVFVDIDPVRRTMNPELLESAITPRTKAIVPVHLYGMPADMGSICSTADKYGIPVVEDAAQAHGARYKGQRVGSFHHIGCFSFYPTKNLGAYGEAGCLVTNYEEIATRARALRDHAQSSRFYYDEIGYNYRMDGFQGAILNVKLKYLDKWNAIRAVHARYYTELLADLPIVLPRNFGDSVGAWYLYVIEADQRNTLKKKLAESGIQTSIHYPLPIHLQKAYAQLGLKRGGFPFSERLAKRCLSLPLYPELTEDQICKVSQILRNIVQKDSAIS